MKQRDPIRTANVAGYNGRRWLGKTKKDNPFAYDTPEYAAWMEGYVRAVADDNAAQDAQAERHDAGEDEDDEEAEDE